MLLSLSGAPRSLYVGRLSPLAASSFPAIFQRKSRLKPRCYWMRRTSLLLSLVMKDDRLCSCGGLVDSRMGSREPGDNASTGSVLAGENRLQPDRLQALGDLSRRRQGLYVYVPASSAGGQRPPAGSETAATAVPGQSCRLRPAIRLLPPAPLLVAGETMNFLFVIDFIPFIGWLPYRGGCPSIEEAFICLFADRKRPQNQSFSRFCGLYQPDIHFQLYLRAQRTLSLRPSHTNRYQPARLSIRL